MGSWDNFYKQLITYNGYKDVIKGLGATIEIAILGLIIGIVIGTVISVIKVMPKYKVVPRILEKVCDVYVALFRGTPMVVQLLIGNFVFLVDSKIVFCYNSIIIIKRILDYENYRFT